MTDEISTHLCCWISVQKMKCNHSGNKDNWCHLTHKVVSLSFVLYWTEHPLSWRNGHTKHKIGMVSHADYIQSGVENQKSLGAGRHRELHPYAIWVWKDQRLECKKDLSTSHPWSDLRPLLPARTHQALKPGRHVLITDGDFKGAEGVIKRIKKRQCVVVQIEGIAAVAITFVPSAWLTTID